jgi:hypothetical protein
MSTLEDHKSDFTEPASLAVEPMSPDELEEIGTRIYGRWGWPVKLGKIVGRDASTLRRWRLGRMPIDADVAARIRSWDEHCRRSQQNQPDAADRIQKSNVDNGVRVARLAIAAHGCDGLKFRYENGRVLISLSRPGRATIIAIEGEGGTIEGLEDIEDAMGMLP